MATIQGQSTGKATDAPDDFADAFAQLTQEDEPPAPAAGDGVPAVAAGTDAPGTEKPAGEAPADDGGLPEPGAIGADGKPVGGEAVAETKVEPEPKPDLTNAEFLAQFRDMLKPAPVAEQPAARPSAVAPFTTEEDAVVEAYKKEWPDVYMAEQLIRKQEYQAVVAHIFNELRPMLGQLQQTTGAIVSQTHTQQLMAAVPDYAEVQPKVLEWVSKQPAYLKAAYDTVVKSGTVQDVADLIGRFRTETGTAAPAPKPAAAAAAATPPAPKPAASAVKGLAPVKSARTGVSTDVVANDDYDAAWKAASSE